ncbi:MAG: cysteine--tRNA ligase [Microscillaceae bacterium]|nr:cysteine--tRNA ligase [Microscillaceae bacterium]
MHKTYKAQGFIPALKFYNTLSKQKEEFKPLNPPHVGLYVCGPTVYNNPHVGNARPYVFFDVVNRYLTYLGYKVRYVRNITDVGHLRANEEDRISNQAKLEQIDPMEVVYRYTSIFHDMMDKLNIKRPSIEPTATGHIVEQIEIIKKIMEAGLAYESDGSVYFDVRKYNEKENYGELSGRIVDELLENTRELEGQEEKRNSADFALWKKAAPDHMMRWPSPWSTGFPGWHLECTVMSTKYLGEQFDIHGGGIDLSFPHHECEIAQAKAAYGKAPVKYWLHNNMVTVNGVKMSKSKRLRWNESALENLQAKGLPAELLEKITALNQPQRDEFEKEPLDYLGQEAAPFLNDILSEAEEFGNFITIEQLFSGEGDILDQSYSPMTIRFFILQAHYRSTLDFSNEALLAAQKGYKRLINSLYILNKLTHPGTDESRLDEKQDKQIAGFCDTAFRGMNDDMNTAIVLGQLSNIVRKINSFYTQPDTLATISQDTFEYMADTYRVFVEEILGLKEEKVENNQAFIEGLLEIYKDAKAQKAYETVDKIREYFKKSGLIIKDLKNGVDWAYQE